MTRNAREQMLNLAFARLHVERGDSLAHEVVGPMATEAFFALQVPFEQRVPRSRLEAISIRGRERAEKMFDRGVRLDSVLPEMPGF